MLHVQSFLLQEQSLEALKELYGIKHTIHPTLPLVILNYSQIDSPKGNPIVRECRGLVLEMDTWNIVARSFNRFFNWGEMLDEQDAFDFSNFVADSNEDGSLVLLYNYDGQWMANTKGSFAMDLMQFQEKTWQQAIMEALEVSDLQQLKLDPNFTYVCEFVSPYNKIVRRYHRPELFLLTAVERIDEYRTRELSAAEVHKIDLIQFSKPFRQAFKSIEHIQQTLAAYSKYDPTFEGFVIRDCNNQRWKIKSPTYLALHRMRGEGDNLYDPKNLLPFIMVGEVAELLVYFPEVEQRVEEISTIVDAAYQELFDAWQNSDGIEDQKQFALKILPETKFSGLLFQLRKEHGIHIPVDALIVKWKESTNSILKTLFK